ncbi:creatinine amidohydrolase [Paenibacillus sp. PvP094]|uniref:creatininase family protein n=1 Tax=Paenibacillus TaxID=44249 RepID=UPI00339684BD
MLDYTNTTAQLTEHNLDTVVIPVGATEQFGPYLPMNLDTLIAEKYAKAYGEVLNAYVLPALPFNTSEEHANFKGTVTVSPNILTAMLEEIIFNLSKQGFCKFLICSGHGGAYWEGAFIKHINYKYPDILVIHPHHQHDAWSVAVKAAAFEGIDELHGGFMSVCTALWLCPEKVVLQPMGSEIPDRNRTFADFMGWDKLTKDGCWGNYVPGELTKEEMAEKGRVFWETFISRKCEGLKEVLEEGYQRKMGLKS